MIKGIDAKHSSGTAGGRIYEQREATVSELANIPGLILCDKSKIYKWGIMGAPDFCLEIVSESTRRKDYIKKLQKYIDAGVKEYWIIDPMRKMLITYCWKDEYIPHLYPLEGKVGLALYDGELQIDLGQVAALIQDYPS